MRESAYPEILKRPIVEELAPTDFAEVTEEQSSTLPNNSLALLSPGELGIVLSVGDFASLPGTTITVPITISDAENLQSLSVSFAYDPSILSIVDPDSDTTENEGVRRAGISADWELEPNNPVVNVNQETGEVSLTLVNNQELPTVDEGGNVPSGTILEVDFEVSEDAELGSTSSIDLQNARVGVNDRDIEVGDSNLGDGNFTVGESATVELFRFRNTTFETGTYVFVGAEERDAIRADENLNQTFALDGVQEDGTINPAFKASTQPGDDLVGFYRLKSLAVPGTFLFVAREEYDLIFAPDSDQQDQWEKEGFNETGEEDIPEFYLLDNIAERGVQFNRFQNNQNNTFLYTGPGETQAIAEDPNLSNLFNDQGPAFKSLD